MPTGFVKLRRGIIEHLKDGRLTPREFLVFTIILLKADFRNSTWIGSASEIAKQCGFRKQYALQYLAALKAKGYIQFEIPRGAHVKYPIFVPKYSVPPGTEEITRKIPNGNRGNIATYQTGTEDFKQLTYFERNRRSEEVKIKKKVKSPPYPPPGGTEIFFEWARKTIAVRMGRRKRLPNLSAYQGGMAYDVVRFLQYKGFEARIVTVQ
jgi:hypothetical protein